MIRYSPKTNEQGYDVGCTWVRDVFQRFYHLQASGYDQILSGPTPTRRTQFTKDPSNRIQDQAWEHTPILRISGCNLPIFAGDLGRCSTARIYTLSIYIYSLGSFSTQDLPNHGWIAPRIAPPGLRPAANLPPHHEALRQAMDSGFPIGRKNDKVMDVTG